MIEKIEPSAAPAAVPAPSPARLVLVWGDDPASRRSWCEALAGEALQVQLADPDRQPSIGADAWVLHATLGMAPSLARLRLLRTLAPATPLLVALRGLRELDQVLALEMGADDVVDTSTSAPVVAARLRALWRRRVGGGPAEEQPELRFGALRLSRHERQVWQGEQRVPLTEGEFAVLWLLASHAGSTMPRREILRRVRGLDDHPMDRSIDSRVYRIRAKLGDNHRDDPRIRTVRNLGYAFLPSGW